jgi:histidyl-tRNA synthetase
VNVTPAPILVTVFDEQLLTESFHLAAELREAGLSVVCYPEAVRLDKQVKYADRQGMRFVLVIGPDEAAKGEVNIKNLATGEQKKAARSALAQELKRLLAEA